MSAHAHVHICVHAYIYTYVETHAHMEISAADFYACLSVRNAHTPCRHNPGFLEVNQCFFPTTGMLQKSMSAFDSEDGLNAKWADEDSGLLADFVPRSREAVA